MPRFSPGGERRQVTAERCVMTSLELSYRRFPIERIADFILQESIMIPQRVLVLLAWCTEGGIPLRERIVGLIPCANGGVRAQSET